MILFSVVIDPFPLSVGIRRWIMGGRLDFTFALFLF